MNQSSRNHLETNNEQARASGVYTLPEGLDVQAKLATVMRRLDDLEAKGVQEVQIVNDGVTQLCLICKSTEHGVQSCPTLLRQDMFTEQANALGTYKQYSSNSPYSNTYNPGWRNHPNLSWREVTMAVSTEGNRFRGNRTNGQQGFQPQASSSNSSLEDMMREFIQKQDKRNEDQNRINAQTSQELVDIRTTLSQLAVSLSQEKGKFPAQPQKNPRGVNEVSEVQKEDCNALSHSEMGKNMKGPKKQSGDKTLEILEVLKQVKINIPLLDMIKQVPAYAKRIKSSKKAFLTEQVGAIIENKAMVKYKDPADRSIKVPRGVVEDVLVQVEKFYYPVDFVVLDTEPLKKSVNFVPIILGRPFLATTNALINLEMNVFNLCKQPMDHDDVENEEACLIEALVQEHTKS
ncbi:hypothetical protein AAG906_002512 [Vitis piasezkii]